MGFHYQNSPPFLGMKELLPTWFDSAPDSEELNRYNVAILKPICVDMQKGKLNVNFGTKTNCVLCCLNFAVFIVLSQDNHFIKLICLFAYEHINYSYSFGMSAIVHVILLLVSSLLKYAPTKSTWYSATIAFWV